MASCYVSTFDEIPSVFNTTLRINLYFGQDYYSRYAYNTHISNRII